MGTLLGVGLAGAVAVAIRPAGVPLDIAVGVSTAASGALLYASYAAFSVAITGAVVFLLAAVGTSPVADAEQRLLATLIGAALALIVYALWPSWSGTGALQALAQLVTAGRRYVAAVLAACSDPASSARASLPGLDRDLRVARTNAEAAAALAANEPAGRRPDPRWAEGLLAAHRRLSLATHALRARLEEERSWPPLPELAPLATAIDQGLGEVVAAVAGGCPPRTGLGLRSLHRRMVAEWDAAGSGAAVAGARAWVAMQTDEMVDALNTLLHVVAERSQRDGQQLTAPGLPAGLAARPR